jgi:glycolate oxidase FAD binding subunit
LLRPECEDELSAVLRDAKGPLTIQGGGTRVQQQACDRQVVTTQSLGGVRLYDPAAMTLIAGAGTPLADVTKLVAKNNQQLAFEPPDFSKLHGASGATTIGGIVATNASGPARVNAGACRDSLLGLRMVDGQGQIIKAGGRVMKNVTGYDLCKLLAGSYGTLGVMTEVALKVLPAPQTTGVLLIDGLSVTNAVAAMSSALGSPFQVTGAAHTLTGLDGHPVTMIRVQGFEASVSYRLEALASRLSHFGKCSVEVDPTRTATGWKWIADLEDFHDRDGVLWRFSVKPSDAPELVERLRVAGAIHFQLDWGGGLVWALCPDQQDLRTALQGGGHGTVARTQNSCPSTIPMFHPRGSVIARIEAGLRQKFDPRGILNPGLMDS